MIDRKRNPQKSKPAVLAGVVALVSLISVSACAQTPSTPPPPPEHEPFASEPPPPPPSKIDQPPQPHSKAVWVKGHWRWVFRRYVWIPGHWAYPPPNNKVWVPGHWARHRLGWFWVPGHWT